MKLKNLLILISLFTLMLYGCENVSEPISISDGAIPAYVIIETTSQDVLAGASLEVLFQLGQTQGENVIVTYSISGEAEEGEDYVFTDGSPGTVTISHDPESTSLDRGSVTLAFPIDAALGTSRNLTFTLESAVTESGESLTIGRGDVGDERTYTINGLGEAEAGTYNYEATGAFGDFSGTFDVEQPATPVIVGANPYLFTTSNITGPLFGAENPTPYAFNITATGSVIGAPNSHVFEGRILDVGGSYDFDTNELIFNATFQCCGVSGASYQIVATPQ